MNVKLNFKLKVFVYISLLFSVFFAYSFSNEFHLIPISWTTIRHYCNYPIQIKIKKWDYSFTTFSSIIKFSTWEIIINPATIDINPFFWLGSKWSITGNLFSAEWGSLNPFNDSMEDVVNFDIKTKEWFTGDLTSLRFVNFEWNDPEFSPENTDDGITITSNDIVWDTLSWVTNATYNIIARPCKEDINPPIVFSGSWSPNISWWKLEWIHTIRLLVLDWIWKHGHYWYQGSWANNMNNYVLAPASVDNQNGVNNLTIRVRINNWWNIEYPEFDMDFYTGSNPSEWTWNSKRRGYWVEFQNTIPFEIEKQVTITITWYDNYNVSGNRYLMNQSFVFNSSDNPTINIITPPHASSGQNYILSSIDFVVSDSWAGVDTDKVFITIPSIYSGTTLLLTGYTYSWSDLQFTLITWSSGFGEAGSYDVKLVPKWKFPSNTRINITGMVVDLAWNTGFGNWHFNTKPSCEDLWCFSILNINFLSGPSFWYNPRLFTWQYLIVTWLSYNTAYPYFTWTNWDTLVCGFDYEGTVLTWNVDIYSNTWIIINGHFYTWMNLYVTWLDFVYNNWVITGLDD